LGLQSHLLLQCLTWQGLRHYVLCLQQMQHVVLVAAAADGHAAAAAIAAAGYADYDSCTCCFPARRHLQQ
jgi:hypothetical protein